MERRRRMAHGNRNL